MSNNEPTLEFSQYKSNCRCCHWQSRVWYPHGLLERYGDLQDIFRRSPRMAGTVLGHASHSAQDQILSHPPGSQS